MKAIKLGNGKNSAAEGPVFGVFATCDLRVVIFGHDSMDMETALAPILPTRKTFGLENTTRLDMKLLAG